MSQTPEPIDCVGNILIKDGFVTVQFRTVPVFQVIAIERGGIHTTNGITPAVVRIICDMSLKQIPGRPFESLLRVVTPGTEELLARLGGKLVEG